MSALKLGILFIRTLSKPIANSIKRQAKTHPALRRGIISLAQAIHRAELTLKLRFLNYPPETIRPLNDTRAVENAADFLGEAFLFSVAGALIVLENARTRQKTANRKEFLDESLAGLRSDVAELRAGLTRQTRVIEEMQRLGYGLGLDRGPELTVAQEERASDGGQSAAKFADGSRDDNRR